MQKYEHNNDKMNLLVVPGILSSAELNFYYTELEQRCLSYVLISFQG